MHFIYEEFNADAIFRHIGIISGNVAALALVFAWVYGRQDPGGANRMRRKAIATLLTIALTAGAGMGIYSAWYHAGFLIADNATLTTALIPISSGTSGTLERFALYEGQRVREGDILGNVTNGEVMRSPVDGLVVGTNAVQNQMVASLEPLAVIADTGRFHIRAGLEETAILKIRLGQPAVVTIDGLGGRQFTGHISKIGRVTQAELSGNPTVYRSGGDPQKATQLFPIEITIEDDTSLYSLIGANARVRIPLR